jgi:hypothetical protein
MRMRMLSSTTVNEMSGRMLKFRPGRHKRQALSALASNMPHFLTAIHPRIFMLSIGLSMATWPVQAGVQLEIVAKFWNAGIELDLVTVVDRDVEATKGKLALVGIATPLRSSFSFRREEWLRLVDLWSKAVKTQSESWKVIGSIEEIETSEAFLLSVSAGPGIKFVIASPRKGPVTYVLSKDDQARFAGALYRVLEFFSR